MQLFETAEIANFSPAEQGAYENSLKYYRDLNNVVDTSRQEGEDSGAARIVVRQLEKRFGQLLDSVLEEVRSLGIEASEALGEALMDFESLGDLEK